MFNQRFVRQFLSPGKSYVYPYKGSSTKIGNNVVTMRGPNMMMDLPALRESTSYVEAKMKQRRMYKRFCRMVI